MALLPRRRSSLTGRDMVATATDLLRDLVPFVQTAVKAADELRDRVAIKLQQRLHRES